MKILSSNVFVYVLTDPRDADHIRYVGVSSRPDKRLKEHVEDSIRGKGRAYYKGAWIRKLHEEGVVPVITVISQHPTRDDAYTEEIWMISHLRGAGHSLTNLSSGGDGYSVNPWDHPGTRAVLTASSIERSNRPENKKAFIKRMSDYWGREENRNAQSERVTEFFRDPANRKAASDRGKMNMTPERREVLLDKLHSPESVAAMRLSKNKPEYREQARQRGIIQFASEESRDTARSHAQRGWDSRSSEQRKEIGAKISAKQKGRKQSELHKRNISLGHRYGKAKRNGLVLELVSVSHQCKETE